MTEGFMQSAKVTDYLKAIGITEPLQKRIETIYEHFTRIFSYEITDILVEEYIKEDGSREYETVDFFSKAYILSAVNFITKDDFRIGPLENQIAGMFIEKENYDFATATEKSRLHVKCACRRQGATITLKASKVNCNYLTEILLKHIIPNMIR